MQDYLRTALEGQAAGTVLPFALEVLARGLVIGSTRFWTVDRLNRKLEIGHTWLAASWQGGFVNPEIEWLMLAYAFEGLGCVRVQFTTDERNARSRAASLRLGAKEEGIIRYECIMLDEHRRNSVRFSSIQDEWPEVRRNLEQGLHIPNEPNPALEQPTVGVVL